MDADIAKCHQVPVATPTHAVAAIASTVSSIDRTDGAPALEDLDELHQRIFVVPVGSVRDG